MDAIAVARMGRAMSKRMSEQAKNYNICTGRVLKGRRFRFRNENIQYLEWKVTEETSIL
jgi:hypothetical protein